ncbi:hypothetical protein SDC9_97285 [bioreactor metagenome]|uniref:Uncharacterized protein n=1 Tax=bioreactor metagenome TaxID=1076179 RepID=A0A645AI53_9ZZZZ|nr:hypothetical protein [Petrimonas sp.]
MNPKLFLLTLFLIGSISFADAQYVNEVAIRDIDADYVMIWSDSGPILSTKITVRVDYGQGGRTSQITDERRRPMSFNGMLAALNMMSRNGFELFEIIRSEKDNQEFYLLRRKNSLSGYDNRGTVEYDTNTRSR